MVEVFLFQDYLNLNKKIEDYVRKQKNILLLLLAIQCDFARQLMVQQNNTCGAPYSECSIGEKSALAFLLNL